MPGTMFLNLPVSDLDRSVSFYKALGAHQNMEFSDETAAMMILSESLHVMLLTHDKFRQFTTKRIADAHESAQALLALSLDSREAVDAITVGALAAGGREVHGPEDHGWMYSRAFDDPDGHGWGPFWMDVGARQATAAGSDEA